MRSLTTGSKRGILLDVKRLGLIGFNDRGMNTNYFYSQVNQMRKRNLIWGLVDENGQWVDSHDKIEVTVISYFRVIS